MGVLEATVRACRAYPWLAPMIRAIDWHDNCEEDKVDGAKGTVMVKGEIDKERVVVESLRMALAHHRRQGKSNVGQWSKSSYLAANSLVPEGDERGYTDFTVTDKRTGKVTQLERGLACEDYYRLIPVEEGDGPAPDGPPGGQEESVAVTSARGKLRSDERTPEEIREAIAVISTPAVPWQRMLLATLGSVRVKGFTARSYDTMHRLQACMQNGVILPGWTSLVPRVGIVIDTSGSMWDELPKIRAEVEKVCKILKFAVDVYQCDTVVRRKERGGVKEWAGGGGTTLSPGIQQAERDGARLIIVITDGYIESDVHRPATAEVVWCMTTDVKMPFGKTVKVGEVS